MNLLSVSSSAAASSQSERLSFVFAAQLPKGVIFNHPDLPGAADLVRDTPPLNGLNRRRRENGNAMNNLGQRDGDKESGQFAG